MEGSEDGVEQGRVRIVPALLAEGIERGQAFFFHQLFAQAEVEVRIRTDPGVGQQGRAP